MKMKVIIGALVLSMMALEAIAATPCGNTKTILDKLEKEYKEVITAHGSSVDGSLQFLLTESPDGKTFTIIITQGDAACVPFMGKDLKFDVPHAGQPT
jgi:hypothetical protein